MPCVPYCTSLLQLQHTHLSLFCERWSQEPELMNNQSALDHQAPAVRQMNSAINVTTEATNGRAHQCMLARGPRGPIAKDEGPAFDPG